MSPVSPGFDVVGGTVGNPVIVFQWIVKNVPCAKGLIPEQWTQKLFDEAARRRINPRVLSNALALARSSGYEFEGVVWSLMDGMATYIPSRPAGPDMTVAWMPAGDKIAEAIRRSAPYLPEEARAVKDALLDRNNLAMMCAAFLAWTTAHFYGVGEVFDALLIAYGWATIGMSVFSGARELGEFAVTAVKAETDADLWAAGRHFANAVTILGLAVIQRALLRGPTRVVRNRGLPIKVLGRRVMPLPPEPGTPIIRYVADLPPRYLGMMDEYGYIELSLKQPIDELIKSRLHELVHRFLTPKTGPLMQLRAELRVSLMERSAFMRYIEEVLAEGYAQLRTQGTVDKLELLRFPIKEGYVTLSRLGFEGAEVGTIMLGGTLMHVSISKGPLPAIEPASESRADNMK